MNEEEVQQLIEAENSGKSHSEILKLFPNEALEVEKILNLINTLKKGGSLVLPNPELLRTILNNNNINSQGWLKGRGLYFKQIIQTMNQKLKLLIPLSALLVVALVVLVKYDQNQADKKAKEAISQLGTQKQNNPPTYSPIAESENVDEAIDGIVSDYAAEEYIVSEDDSDITYVNDSYSTINLNDIYNENEF